MCALTLVSSPHLARSYHHLFPVPPFTEVPPPQVAELAAVRFVGGFPVLPVLLPSEQVPSRADETLGKDANTLPCKCATCMPTGQDRLVVNVCGRRLLCSQ